jgi:hypothetical protein
MACSAVNAMAETVPPLRSCRVSCVGTASSTVIAVAVLGLGQRRTARPGLAASGGLVRLLGALGPAESVLAVDALD